jgi:hypothetical protein
MTSAENIDGILRNNDNTTRSLTFGQRRFRPMTDCQSQSLLAEPEELESNARGIGERSKASRQLQPTPTRESAAQIRHFLLLLTTKPLGYHCQQHVSFLRSHIHPPCALFAGPGFQSLIRVTPRFFVDTNHLITKTWVEIHKVEICAHV